MEFLQDSLRYPLIFYALRISSIYVKFYIISLFSFIHYRIINMHGEGEGNLNTGPSPGNSVKLKEEPLAGCGPSPHTARCGDDRGRPGPSVLQLVVLSPG